MVEAGARQVGVSGLAQGIARLRKWDGIGILIALLILTAMLSVAAPAFLSQYNLSVVARQASFVGLIALGQTLVLLDRRHRSLGRRRGRSVGDLRLAAPHPDRHRSLYGPADHDAVRL